MDYSDEKLKPLYAVRGALVHSASEPRLGNQQALEDAGNGVALLKAAELTPELEQLAVSQSDPETELQLIIARLRALPEQRFGFVDGYEWTGEEAAREVEKDTDWGRYFRRFEERVLQLAREAHARGEF